MTADLRYPIGKFEPPAVITPEARAAMITQIDEAPQRLRQALRGLTQEQLDHPYRDGGWTLHQVTHHVPDSHLNAYVRFKLTVTEEEPAVRGYDETRWAELPDARDRDIEMSLSLLEALHRRWVVFLRNLTEEEWHRSFRHPDHGTVPLDRTLALYAWHGRHHTAHITSLRDRMGWR